VVPWGEIYGHGSEISPHSLRRTFATDIYRATGCDLVATQRIVGHSSPLVTANYLRTDQDELDAVVRTLGSSPLSMANPIHGFAAGTGLMFQQPTPTLVPRTDLTSAA